jgi:hypothetical protein
MPQPIKITKHAADRLRQRRRFFKHRGLSGVQALAARLDLFIEQGRVQAEAPVWYRGAGDEPASRYVILSPTLAAVVAKNGGRKTGRWVCVTVVTRESRAAVAA